MDHEIQIGSKVLLVSFNGKTVTPININPDENFWALIGATGVVVDDTPPKGIKKNRVLISFNVSLKNMGLPCHNEVKNSLWIERSDLQVVV